MIRLGIASAMSGGAGVSSNRKEVAAVEERLQKLLSAAGVCSRRQAEEYIQAGRVTLNGSTARLGEKADRTGIG